jgi:hypothetical protein
MKISKKGTRYNNIIKKVPLSINFSTEKGEYDIYYSNNDNKLLKLNIPSQLICNESLILIAQRFKFIKFTGLSSLIESCKNAKLHKLQLVFEWIYCYIYKVK